MGYIFVGMPTYDGCPEWEAAAAIYEQRARNKDIDVMILTSSALTYGFNRLYCAMLNNPMCRYWVLLHADIIPERGNWVSHLVTQMDATGADVMSAVMPLKNPEGSTSTALGLGENPVEDGTFRRLTMHEAMELPECFNRKHLADLFNRTQDPALPKWDWGECHLLNNTGLMCIRGKRRDVLETLHFDVRNGIRKNAQGKWECWFEPEDWLFSRQAEAAGLNVWATRSIPARHVGKHGFPNASEWGTLEHDTSEHIIRQSRK